MICPNCGHKSGALFTRCLCTWDQMHAAVRRRAREEAQQRMDRRMKNLLPTERNDHADR